MGMRLHVHIDTSKLDQITAHIDHMDDIIAELCAEEIDGYAMQAVPVRSGRLKASGGIHLMGHSWINYFSAPYAGFVEMGTRFMGAQSYLRVTLGMVGWIENVIQAARLIGL